MTYSRQRVEPALKKFLREATIAYANGDTVEFDPADESLHGTMYEGHGFTLMDTWHQSKDDRVYHGTESVSRSGDLIWEASYHGVISPESSAEEVMPMYLLALQEPDQYVPIRGPDALDQKTFLYAFDTGFVRSLGNFVATEYIYIPQTQKRVYEGTIIGGYVDVS